MKTLDLPHHSSPTLKIFYIAVTLFSSLCVIFTAMHLLVKTAAALLLLCSVFAAWRNCRFLDSLERIQLSRDDLHLVINNKKYAVLLKGNMYISNFLLACEFQKKAAKGRHKRMSVIILPDSMSEDDRRQLRAALVASKHFS